MADVAISYRRCRRFAVQYLEAALVAHGYSVWWDDKREIGGSLSPQIQSAFSAARAIIVIWCTQSVESDWVKDEALLAIEHGTYLPIAIEDMKLPTGFRQRPPLEMFRWDGALGHEYFGKLIVELSRLTKKSPVVDRARVAELEGWRTRERCGGLAQFPMDAVAPQILPPQREHTKITDVEGAPQIKRSEHNSDQKSGRAIQIANTITNVKTKSVGIMNFGKRDD